MGCSSCKTTKVVAPQAAWLRLGGHELEGPILSCSVALVRADWLVQLAEDGGTLRRRQDLPADAFISLNELKVAGSGSITQPVANVNWEWLRIIVLSHPWLQPGHPDPHGQNLRIVAKALRAFIQDSTYTEPGLVFPYINAGRPYGVLIDFTALFQVPRTAEENVQFKKALPELHRFYAHPNTVVLKVTRFPMGYPTDPACPYELREGSNTADYAERGWCYAESAMSDLVKDSSKVLDLDRLPGSNTLAEIIFACRSGRQPPLSPDEFDVKLNSKTFTSKTDDFDTVAKLYRNAFVERIESATELDYSGLGWDAIKVRQLMQAVHTNSALESLNLGGNRLLSEGVVGQAMQLNSAIQTLNLWDNNIGEGVRVFGQALQTNNSLHSLNLGRNDIDSAGANALAQALRLNKTLQTLNLQRNRIGDEGAGALGQALQINTTLHTVNLQSNGIGPGGANVLGQALQHNNSILTLTLTGNYIGTAGARALGQGLQRNNTLQTLTLLENNIHGEGARVLGEALQHNHTLRTLNLANNDIDAEGAKALGQALQKNNALRTLNLEDNRIGDEGTSALGQALQHNNALQTLNLWGNNIGAEGTVVLGKALQHNNALRTLILVHNDIGVAGAQALGEALQHNKTLETLNLVDIHIEAEGTNPLSQGLQHNKTLQTLLLAFNNIGEEGANALGKALERNTSLTALSLYSCGIGATGTRGLAQALRGKGALTQLDVGRNSIRPEGVVVLAEALRAQNRLAALNLGDRVDAVDELTRKFFEVMRQDLDELSNIVGDEGAKSLGQALELNKALAKLTIPAPEVSEDGLRLLHQVAMARGVDLVVDSVAAA